MEKENRFFLPLCCLVLQTMAFAAFAKAADRDTTGAGENKDGKFVAVFWNLENYFDYTDGGQSESDKEFSSFGRRHWTKKKFEAKSAKIAKGIFYLADKYGQFPDVIGLAEVENGKVLYKLLHDTNLRKTDYCFVHFDSHDRRGIDVALLYRGSKFRLLGAEAVTPLTEDGDTIFTRDILYAVLEEIGAEKASGTRRWDILVNHHPSKFGGVKESGKKRREVMMCMCEICERVLAGRSCRKGLPGNGAVTGSDGEISTGPVRIIAMGDFNDTPDGEQFALVEDILVNKAVALHGRGEGTIRYEGKWELIDMFFVSRGLAECSRMEVCRIPFLMERDKRHAGDKPKRTYSGPRYNGGVSDHLPIVLAVCETSL